MCEQLLANPLIESYEIDARGTADGAPAADRRRRLPGLERRPGRGLGARRARRRARARSGTRDASFRTCTASSCPAASRTATTSAAARSRASRRRWRRSPSFAADGGPVLGICNGFQILCEAGLLPGVLRPNASLAFVCRDVRVRVERADTPFTSRCAQGQRLVDPRQARRGLLVRGRRAARRARPTSTRSSCATTATTRTARSATSRASCNAEGNVLGLMPHPEHAVDPLLGSATARSSSPRSSTPRASDAHLSSAAPV